EDLLETGFDVVRTRPVGFVVHDVLVVRDVFVRRFVLRRLRGRALVGVLLHEVVALVRVHNWQSAASAQSGGEFRGRKSRGSAGRGLYRRSVGPRSRGTSPWSLPKRSATPCSSASHPRPSAPTRTRSLPWPRRTATSSTRVTTTTMTTRMMTTNPSRQNGRANYTCPP